MMATRNKELITVLVSSSVIPTHPSLHIIQETLASVRFHLPDSKIFILQDGVRPEQESRSHAYHLYLAQLASKLVFSGDHDIAMWPFIDFTHQAGMTMRALKDVTTPLMLFVEHDTPLVEKPINWPMLADSLLSGSTNHIRLHYDEEINPEHMHMMCGYVNPNLIKTTQWHQRPHLALTKWYEQVLHNNFNEKSRTFIEDKVYSPVSSADWNEYRLTIYDPEGTGKNMKRSRDLNGRGGEPKYEMIF
jgi:hypothetical protein